MKRIVIALLLVSAPVAAAPSQAEAAPAAKPADEAETKASKADIFDPAQLMAMFDKLFPAQPDPMPARLTLSRVAVQGLLPDGTYARLVDGVMDSFVDRIMDLSAADLGAKPNDGKVPSKETLRQAALKDDPHFEERMRITERVITEEIAKLAKIMEPKLREGLARSMARRFDEKQLTDLNAFLASDSGRAFGSQSMAMWMDSDVIRGMLGAFPEIIEAMPAAMKRLETETAHLPKPKKKEAEQKDESNEEPEEE